MTEFDLSQATHQILPDQIRQAVAPETAIIKVLSWLSFGLPHENPTAAEIDDPDNYRNDLYLDQKVQLFGIIAGAGPGLIGVIDLKKGIREIHDFLGAEEPEVEQLSEDVIALLRTFCQAQ